MIYCDASLLVAVVASERFSAEAGAWFDRQTPGALAWSGWTDVEVASALARKQRSRLIGASDRADAESRWRWMAASMTFVEQRSEDFRVAAGLVDSGMRGLRAGDALHLAVALNADLSIATLDRDLADAAEAVGMGVALRPPA